jgi:outer membrane protein TolC
VFHAQNAQAAVRLNRLLTSVQLYNARGGGWSLTDPQWSEQAKAGAG